MRFRSWSIRAHLAALLVLLFALIGILTWVAIGGAYSSARRDARRTAEFQAQLAANDIASKVPSLAANVDVLAAFDGYEGIFAGQARIEQNEYRNAAPLDQGRFDVVDPSGRIVSTSASLPLDVRQRGYRLTDIVTALPAEGPPVPRGPVVDPATGRPSLVVGKRIPGLGGAVLAVIDVERMAGYLADRFGGPDRSEILLTNADSTQVVSRSLNPGGWTGRPVPAGFVPSDGEHADVDGRQRIYGRATASSLNWHVLAGADTDRVLAVARGHRNEQLQLAGLSMLLIAVAAVFLSRRIARPVRELTSAVGVAARITTPEPVTARGPRELATLAEEFNTMLEARGAVESRLVHQQLHDPLTGLANRALLKDRLGHALERAERRRTTVAVVFVDLDLFKLVNDASGHAAGDGVIVTMAERIGSVLRPDDTVARFGGDEFVVLLEDIGSPEMAVELSRRIERVVAEPIEVAGNTIVMTASIGIASATAGLGGEPDDLLRDADVALTRAKDSGRARIEVFDPSMHERVRSRLDLDSALRAALDNGELRAFYQPEIALQTGRVFGVEALVRWERPGHGMVSPAEFIPLAEETGLIVPLGAFVLETACRDARRWQESGREYTVSVNLSRRQLTSPGIVDTVAVVLAETRLRPDLLCLEITESLIMDDPAASQAALDRLKALGVKLAIDDFGTGYSSLATVQRFPADILKIDQSFVGKIGEESGTALVETIISMGRALRMHLVAEGVETAEQMEVLRRLGCDIAQGYFFAKPSPLEALPEWFHHGSAPAAAAGATPL